MQHLFGHHIFTNIEGYDPDRDAGPEVNCLYNAKQCLVIHCNFIGKNWVLENSTFSKNCITIFISTHLHAHCIFYSIHKTENARF